jgi:hypothetical protein
MLLTFVKRTKILHYWLGSTAKASQEAGWEALRRARTLSTAKAMIPYSGIPYYRPDGVVCCIAVHLCVFYVLSVNRHIIAYRHTDTHLHVC